MIRICVKKPFYSYERVIFPNQKIESKADVVRYMRFTKDENCGLRLGDESETLINDLTESEDELFMGYDKKVRNEIRRADKEDIKFCFYDAHQVISSENEVRDIIEKYYVFCDEIGKPELKNNLNKVEFNEYIKNGYIAISKAEYGEGWVYHIYLYDDTTAMLWFSFSGDRNLEGKKPIAGWANRALHHKDMMAFKQLGIKRYEWGGISSSTEPNGIDKFKMNFGGQVINVYFDLTSNTIKGSILICLKRMLGTKEKE